MKYDCFDVASVFFCPESITNNEKDYISSIKNVTNLIKKDGIMVMGVIKNAKYYKVGKRNFPALPIDEEYLENTLNKLKCEITNMSSVDSEDGKGYDGLITLTARKL